MTQKLFFFSRKHFLVCLLCVEGFLKQEKVKGCWFVDRKGSVRMQVLIGYLFSHMFFKALIDQETERPCLLHFCVEVAGDFKARAILVLRLRMANSYSREPPQ